jgi:hypothetical protein
MPVRQKIMAVAIAIAIFIVILELVRRRRLREEYSWLWLLTGTGLIVLTVRYDLLVKISRLIGASCQPDLFWHVSLYWSVSVLDTDHQADEPGEGPRQEIALLRSR